jgi:hypothetical protein
MCRSFFLFSWVGSESRFPAQIFFFESTACPISFPHASLDSQVSSIAGLSSGARPGLLSLAWRSWFFPSRPHLVFGFSDSHSRFLQVPIFRSGESSRLGCIVSYRWVLPRSSVPSHSVPSQVNFCAVRASLLYSSCFAHTVCAGPDSN